MDHTQQDLLAFFSQQPLALPLCEAFRQNCRLSTPRPIPVCRRPRSHFPTGTFCLPFLCPGAEKALLPDPYLVLTLGLPAPLASPRAEIKNRTLPRPLDPSHPAVHPG